MNKWPGRAVMENVAMQKKADFKSVEKLYLV